jgi:phosphoribosylformimino-5-aminoimidazole carboxamide ribotide isomerase
MGRSPRRQGHVGQALLHFSLPQIFAESCISARRRLQWAKDTRSKRFLRATGANPQPIRTAPFSAPFTGRKPLVGAAMLIFPAIDLRGGQCVRLRQGDYAQETVFGADPVAMARRWVRQGAVWLHLVDLDGARQGQPVNGDVIQQIVQATAVPCQLGGGLRSEEHLAEALSWGVERVILGTRALQDPAWCEQMANAFPGQVALGIDARNGLVATEGWVNVSTRTALDLGRHCAAWPLAALIYTDISKDGMLEGPNVEATAELADAVAPLPVIASGGVTSLDDVARLARRRLAGCIIGRALYEDRISLPEVLALVRKEISTKT